MFESVKTLDNRPNGLMYFASLLVSIAVHTAIISAIVLVPLVFCSVLPESPILTFLLDAPPVPLPPVPPTPPARSTSSGKYKEIQVDGFHEPKTIPGAIPPPDPHANYDDLENVIQGIGGPSLGTGPNTSVVALLIKDIRAEEPPEPKRPAPRTPVRVSAPILQSKLVHRVDPIYPPLAIRTHTSGEVILEATIDEEGNVMQPVRVLKGHPLLVDAAVQAVSQWKYSPTIQGGEPMQIIALVTVVFTLK
jgi:periplasmic protein TonB